MATERRNRIRRRSFLLSAGSLIATPLLGGLASRSSAQAAAPSRAPAAEAIRRRRLGSLEVSAVGMGVQNVAGRYETTVPYRPAMVDLIRAAFAEGDIRGVEPRFSPENLPHNLVLVDLVKRWAERKQAAPAQIALAWLLAQKPWIVPIPGTTDVAHMLQNTGAASVTFSPAEIAELNSDVSAIEVQGQRLPDFVLEMSGVEAPPKN